ncbi:sulfurtransferase [Salinilacihabitans rarus]|uniref:sulfurtransferase n=1 Tax=Salinilacihabitans rarus TaxID=2961596 RepID=UPI0020C90814|nr:sulfurtransferase [Salinilacihabitans rarus]
MDDSVVVSFEWLADRLDDPEVRVVDVRDGWEFEGIGHLPGAANVPFDRFRDDGDADRGTLPGADAFAALLSEAGIERGDTLVAYDDTFGVFAARFLVTAHEYGHPDVRLLAGDYSAWSRERETTTNAPAFESTTYEPDPLASAESPLVDRAAVEDAIEEGALPVDTRDPREFAQAHLPGAVRFDWREVVDEERRRLRPREEVRDLLADSGIAPDRRIVLYCNTARRISHTFVVLRWLGFEDVGFYEGSLAEWLAADGAVETGGE